MTMPSAAARTPEDWTALIRPLARARRERALTLSREALEQAPDSPVLHLLRAEALIELGQDESAERHFAEALALGKSAKFALRAARLRARQGRIGEAIALAEGAVRKGGTPGQIQLAATILLDLGEFDAALRAAGPAPEADGRLAEIRAAAGEGLRADAARGVTPAARRAYLLGMGHLAAGEAAEAAREFKRVAASCPRAGEIWLGWRGALEALGKPEKGARLGGLWRDLGGSESMADTVLRRRLSPRGLVFDPRESYPIRPARELLRAVHSPQELKAAQDAILTVDPGGAPVELDPVISLVPSGEDRFVIRHISSPRFVAAIEGAALIGRGVVATRDGVLVEELLGSDPAKLVAQRTGDQLRFANTAFEDGACPVQVFDTPAFLVAGPTDSSFGDWMVNFAPRLALAEAAELDCPVVVRAKPMASALDCLAALGVPRDRVIFHDENQVSLFPRLYAPSWPLPERNRPMADLFGVFRRTHRRAASGPRERIYLSRELIPKRQMVNEPEVRALFEARGFRIVQPERLSFEEMLSVFARPACVAGPYGSAFLNLAYCIEPPVALAFAPPVPRGFLDELAFWLGGCGVRFAYLRGEPIGEPVPKGPWRAPLDRVEAAIDRLLEEAG